MGARRRRRRHSPRSGLRRWPWVCAARAFLLLLALTLLAYVVGKRPLLIAWLIGASVTALVFYGYDKLVAPSGRSRVPEWVLLGLALVGGSPGAIAGMILFWHKVSKRRFLLAFGAVLLAQIGLLVLIRYAPEALGLPASGNV